MCQVQRMSNIIEQENNVRLEQVLLVKERVPYRTSKARSQPVIYQSLSHNQTALYVFGKSSGRAGK